jgi:leucine dehydrogenase
MKITSVDSPMHEEVVRIEDPSVGLVGFIAIHSTRRGPAVGGLRMRRYGDEAEALEDVLRLSRGMTCKNAAADLPLGGGKAVILGDPATKTEALLRTCGRAIDAFGGRYWTAEDMGMSPADMAVIAGATPYVAGLPDGPFASGDPSPVTARGIFNAIRTTARYRLGSPEVSGRCVAVQGLGHVGAHLCRLLDAAGARLVVADVDAGRAAWARAAFGATTVGADEILAAEADILAPCAIGAILNAQTIPHLRVAAVAGGANNQLATPEDGRRLHDRGILYAPDFVANGGGVINVATEVLRIADRAGWIERRLAALDATLDAILGRAQALGQSPNDVAEATVEALLRKVAA